MLWVTGAVDFADWANIPLRMDTDMSEMVAFEAGFPIAGVVTGKGGVNRYALDGTCGIDFVAELHTLESELHFGREWGGGCGGGRLWVHRCGQLFNVVLHVINTLQHLQLIEGRE